MENPAWTTTNEKDGFRTVAIQDTLDGNDALDKKLMVQHWSKESEYSDDELTRWKEFRLYQKHAENNLWLKIDFDPNATDPGLANILVKLNDWREFQNYQQVKVGHYDLSIREIMENLEDIVRDETVYVEAAGRSLDRFFELQMALESSGTLLTWVEGQIPEILAKTSATLEASTLLQRKFETELEQQAHAFHQKLLSLEARPDRSVRTPSHSLGFTQKICHWGLETTRLMKDLWEWKVFLEWRRTKLYKSGTSSLEGQTSDRLSSHVQVWVDFVAFRQYELDRTRNWVEIWQRMLPEKENALMTTEEKDLGLDDFQRHPTNVRSNVEAFQRDVHTAETRLRSAEQQLAQLSSQQSSSASVQGAPYPGWSGWIIEPDVESWEFAKNLPTIAGAGPGQEGWVLVPEVESHGTQRVARRPSYNYQLPSSRQTRSATKQKDILSSRTPMEIRKHSSKKDKP